MASEQRGDIVFVGGRVWTGVERRRPEDSVVVRDGRIAAVGSADELAWAIGPRTRVIRLRGRLLLPGFHDSHAHPLLGGLAEDRCALAGDADLDGLLAAVAAYATAHPERPWVLGRGWSLLGFGGGLPRAADLDAVVPDRPVLLESLDGHGAWVNSAALAAAGLDEATLDPRGGRLERDEDGSPSGLLLERAVDLVARHAPRPTEEDLEAALLRAQAHLHRLGVVGWNDAHATADREAAYRAVARRGELTGRVSLSMPWDPGRGLEQVPTLVARRDAIADDEAGRLRATGVKLFQDGVIETATAALLDAYLDGRGRPTREYGASHYNPDALRDICVALDDARLAVHVHAVGDRAVREALDALTAARKVNGPRDGRHGIAHVGLVHPSDLIRFAALGVYVSAQPYWAWEDPGMRSLVRPLLGAERTARMYPLASLARTGATLALGSDWCVSTADPLRILQVAISRLDPDGRAGRPLGPVSERLRPEVALRAYTRGSAMACWQDDVSGTIEVGKAADLALLDRDPLAPGGGAWVDARVLLTLVDGRVVHQDAAIED